MKKHILEYFDTDSAITNEQFTKQIFEEKQRLAQWLNDRYGLHLEIKIIESDDKKDAQ